ncbi:MAG: hypothetical protein HQ582_16550, partial [Planctomycetes bacterium]|nr:hypothetical protein [Planctomycetota bacterium]
MAKRTGKTESKSDNGGAVSKAQAIRDYHAEHPDAGPTEIAEALAKKGIEVNAGRVSGVLRSGTSRSKVDVETVKLAAEFVGQYKGSIEEA